jgi:hypothetical protein
MFTELERTRLEKRNDATMDPKEKRYNDMIVRNKIKQWLEDTKDVLFAIDKLPKKQVRKLATDEQAFNLLTIDRHFLDALEFAQIQGNSIEDAVAVKTIRSIDKWEKWARKAEENDFMRNIKLILILNNYKSYLDTSPALDEYLLKNTDKLKNWISSDLATIGNGPGQISIKPGHLEDKSARKTIK